MPGDLEGLEPIKSKGVDFSQFEGQKKPIEKVEVIDTTTPFDEEGTYHQDLKRDIKVLKVATGVVTTIETNDGAKDIYATELFNLKLDPETSTWGWPTGKKGKLQLFMNKLGVSHPRDLIGKDVILRVRSKEGSDNEFLGFFTS